MKKILIYSIASLLGAVLGRMIIKRRSPKRNRQLPTSTKESDKSKIDSESVKGVKIEIHPTESLREYPEVWQELTKFESIEFLMGRLSFDQEYTLKRGPVIRERITEVGNFKYIVDDGRIHHAVPFLVDRNNNFISNTREYLDSYSQMNELSLPHWRFKGKLVDGIPVVTDLPINLCYNIFPSGDSNYILDTYQVSKSLWKGDWDKRVYRYIGSGTYTDIINLEYKYAINISRVKIDGKIYHEIYVYNSEKSFYVRFDKVGRDPISVIRKILLPYVDLVATNPN